MKYFDAVSNAEIEIPSLSIDDSDGDEYVRVANMEDMLLLVHAMGFEDIAHFDSECELPADSLIGKFFMIQGKAGGKFNMQPVYLKESRETPFSKRRKGV